MILAGLLAFLGLGAITMDLDGTIALIGEHVPWLRQLLSLH